MKERARQARELAAAGRGEGTEIAHVAVGELVVPAALQSPEVLDVLRRAAASQNIPFDRLRVGSAGNSINPNTGVAEFASPGQLRYELEGITVTAPSSRGAQYSSPGGGRSRNYGRAGAEGGGVPQPYVYDAPPTEELTVTTPPWPNFWQLPQAGSNRGFYNYGTPDKGRAQYGSQPTVDAVMEAGSRWQATGAAPFGVGNMSQEDGLPYDGHKGHQMTGRDVDIRPIRRDGNPGKIKWNLPDGSINPEYDRDATQRLVDTLRATGGVNRIFFNDPAIRGVTPFKGHDNHMHMEVSPLWKRR